MSKTLNMAEHVLALGERFLECGREQEALDVLEKISHLAEVPPAITVESQLRLAEIHLRHRRHLKARRHLNVVLACLPDSAQAHYLMATTLRQQERPELRRAARHYRKAIEFAADEPAYAADYGLCLLDLGRDKAGLRYLRRAVELAPDDVDYVHDLAMKLLDLGHAIDARRVVLAALFRQPQNGDFRKLWNDVRFHEARLQQRRQPRLYRGGDNDEPALLPFHPASSTGVAAPDILPMTVPLPRPARRMPRRQPRRETL